MLQLYSTDQFATEAPEKKKEQIQEEAERGGGEIDRQKKKKKWGKRLSLFVRCPRNLKYRQKGAS